jgi:FAD/FMN-containing dehydrogenase
VIACRRTRTIQETSENTQASCQTAEDPTLGGGFGWLTRKYGMTIDNLISVDAVNADGQQIRASESENADLFWAIRGGGGDFAVITQFEFGLHSVGPEIFAGYCKFRKIRWSKNYLSP